MSIDVNGKTIQTDEAGYLLNDADWNIEVRDALIKKHEADGHKFISKNTRKLINYFRDYYQKIDFLLQLKQEDSCMLKAGEKLSRVFRFLFHSTLPREA